jgi:chloride channel protein, CIC family
VAIQLQVSAGQLRGRWVLVGVPVAFTIVGLLAIRHPQLRGNGQGMAQAAFTGSCSGVLGLLLVLAILKPLATALCLGSGATGRLFTPTLSTGAVLGAALGIVWNYRWPGAPVGSYAASSPPPRLSAPRCKPRLPPSR